MRKCATLHQSGPRYWKNTMWFLSVRVSNRTLRPNQIGGYPWGFLKVIYIFITLWHLTRGTVVGEFCLNDRFNTGDGNNIPQEGEGIGGQKFGLSIDRLKTSSGRGKAVDDLPGPREPFKRDTVYLVRGHWRNRRGFQTAEIWHCLPLHRVLGVG